MAFERANILNKRESLKILFINQSPKLIILSTTGDASLNLHSVKYFPPTQRGLIIVSNNYNYKHDSELQRKLPRNEITLT